VCRFAPAAVLGSPPPPPPLSGRDEVRSQLLRATGARSLTNPYRLVTRGLCASRRLPIDPPSRKRGSPMRRAGASRRARPRDRYRSLASFYTADERRIHSRELDVGLWWREDADGPMHRAAWVNETGDLYLVRLGPAAEGGGSVEVLGTAEDRERLETALDGWRERCGEPGSLSWLRERAALRLPASPDDARARPREPAPTARRNRRAADVADGYQDRGRALPAGPLLARR
jgi:hypothetical protein